MPSNKIVLIAVAVLLLPLLGAGLYFLSARNNQSVSSTPTPTAFESPAVEESSSPIPTGSAKPTGTPKPTPTKTPTPSPIPNLTTTTLNSSSSLDGFESSNGGGNPSADIRAGRNSNLTTRGFVSFDLGSLPSGASIQKATLRLYQTSVVGNPYSVGGNLLIDHLDYGSSLENSDYSATNISGSFATLTGNSAVEWKDVDVTSLLRDDLVNSRTRSQFRIHFATEAVGGTVTGDFAYFESSENSSGTGNTPQLIIKYQ